MGLFRRTRGPAERLRERALARDGLTHVLVVDDAAPAPERPDARPALRRIASEALILQDAGTALLDDVRARRPLAEVAPRGGPIARRFFELRRELPAAGDAETARQREALQQVLSHHGMLVSTALDMLSMDWRSPAIVDQCERLRGFGPQAERLEALWLELR